MLDATALGARLRRLREARGRSLREVAAAVRLAPSFLSDVERGRARPSLESLAAIAAALDVPLADLFAPEAAPRTVDLRRALGDPAVSVHYGGRPLTAREREGLLQIVDAALRLQAEARPRAERPAAAEAAEAPDVLSAAAHLEGDYDRPPSPELLALIRAVVREVREEIGAPAGEGRAPWTDSGSS